MTPTWTFVHAHPNLKWTVHFRYTCLEIAPALVCIFKCKMSCDGMLSQNANMLKTLNEEINLDNTEVEHTHEIMGKGKRRAQVEGMHMLTIFH